MTPIPAGQLANVEEVGSGLTYSCARTTEGRIWCWGTSSWGEFGTGTNTAVVATKARPVPSVDRCTSLAVGQYHVCATCNGELKCWGWNGYGEVTAPASPVAAPSVIPNAADVVGVAVGYASTYLIGASLRAFGANTYGQLGDGTLTSTPSPRPFNLRDLAQLSAGTNHACARTRGGRVACWGSNADGQLGDGTTRTPIPVPQLVPNLTNVIQVAAGNQSSCAVLEGGDVTCWGRRVTAQAPGVSLTPTLVPGIVGAKAVTLSNQRSCAVLIDNGVVCWGGAAATRGDGPPINDETSRVILPAGALQIAAGADHVCATLGDHRVVCWGNNASGQLGRGDTVSSGTPGYVLTE